MKTQQLIEEIHGLFNTAGERLVEQAKELINQPAEEKANRLKRVGFSQCAEVEKWDAVALTIETVRLVEYYGIHYPNNKFITEPQVLDICKKYNLACAGIDRYKGFVPDMKLRQIEAFSVMEKDRCDLQIVNVEFSYKNVEEREIEEAIKHRSNKGVLRVTKQEITCTYPKVMNAHLRRFDIVDNQSLRICAPIKDMNLKGLSEIGGLFLSLTRIHVPDPVVLQPVKGGYLIVCAWGDEASDEIVVNQKMN